MEDLDEIPYTNCTKSASSSSSSAWFDIRVFYVRISNLPVDNNSTPEFLTLNHVPLNPNTLLQLNSTICKTQSQGISCVLKRDRVDKRFEESTFVSTDSIRLTGSAKFEVFHKENLVLSGVLELVDKNGVKKWWMDCEPVMMSGETSFFMGNQIVGSGSLLPNVEVYIAGCFLGTPVILTKSLQLTSRKKKDRKTSLDSIPEYEASGYRDSSSGLDLQMAEYRSYDDEDDQYKDVYWRRPEDGEEYGELSWFNAGVRVGVGIGLGICLGVGIGVGIFVRTYQATSRNLKRRLP
jgi:hypothetical protein